MSEGSRKGPSLVPSSSSWRLQGLLGLWSHHSNLCLHLYMASSPVGLSPLLSFVRILVIEFRVHPEGSPHLQILNLIISAKTFFPQIRSHSQIPGARPVDMSFGGHSSTHHKDYPSETGNLCGRISSPAAPPVPGSTACFRS